MKPALPYLLALGGMALVCLGLSIIIPQPPAHSIQLPHWWPKQDPEEPLFHNGTPCVRDKSAPANGPIPKGYRLLDDPHPTRTLPPDHPLNQPLPYPYPQPTISNP